jgi:hypothetical protein
VVHLDKSVAQVHCATRVGGDVSLMRDEDNCVAARYKFSNNSMISSPVLESRFPVGSSARIIDGPLTSARAMATR